MERAVGHPRSDGVTTPGRRVVRMYQVLALVTGLLLVNVSGALAAPKPSVTLSPTSGPPGTPVTVTGRNWPPGHTISVAFPDRGFWGPGSTTSRPDGSFEFSFTWPSPASPGDHQVAIIDNTGPVDAPPYPVFTVTTAPAAGGSPTPQDPKERGPSWISPRPAATIPYPDDLVFEVTPIPGAREYLFGFFENDRPVWENYANDRRLDGPTYVLPYGSPGHRALGEGAGGRTSWPLQLWVRGYIHDGGDRYHWSEASVIDVTLVGFSCISGPGGACTYGPTPGFSVGDARQMSIRTVWDLVKFGNLACDVLGCPAWSDSAASNLVRQLGRADDLINIALIPSNFQRVIDSGNALGDAIRAHGKEHPKTREAARQFCRTSETAVRGVHGLFPVPGLGEGIFPIPACPVD